jgi:hypothetical protein
MSIWTLATTGPHTTVTANCWTDPIPHLTIRIDHATEVTINLPAREETAARLLTELIEQAERLLASIPEATGPHSTTTNRQ